MKAVSLFAGAGGLDMGFHNKGVDIIWANDLDRDACETHALWSNTEIFQGDIKEIAVEDVPRADIIIGGFPCQGFSLAGPRKINDERNILYKYFVELVEHQKPAAFVAENVKGILTLGGGTIIDAIITDFSNKGYDVFPNLINAADFGVAQDRWRVVLMGFKKELDIKHFKLESISKRSTIREAIKDIKCDLEKDVCIDGYSSRFMSRNRKRNWDEVSYTIPAMAKQIAIHPSSPNMIKVGTDKWIFGEGNTRRLSWQEAAAIQSFPKGMSFSGNLTSKYKQIGNAVPVKLAEAVAECLVNKLGGNNGKTN
ncbi:MAG: DNA cytosine methyltransferase, partial [Anaerovoracaceae bacterium]